MARQRRTVRKDEYVGIRMPGRDRKRFHIAAECGMYDLSDLVWRSAIEGLEIIRRREPRINEELLKAGF
jgi:hypothetical protein